MSSTGRAISSAYWKRSKLPSAEGKLYCVKCSRPTFVAETNIFFCHQITRLLPSEVLEFEAFSLRQTVSTEEYVSAKL